MNDIRKNLYQSPIIRTPYGQRRIIYADTTASGLPYKIINEYIEDNIYPYYANTHSNAYNGRLMCSYMDDARKIIRSSVNANKDDVILFTGSGCTGAINHFIHAFGLKH